METYGLRIVGRRFTVALIACTGYFPELETAFRADVLILNVVYREPRDEIHLALPDARQLIAAMRPRLAVITHFGLTMLRARPWELAESLSQDTGVRVVAARDRWRLDLEARAGALRAEARRPGRERALDQARLARGRFLLGRELPRLDPAYEIDDAGASGCARRLAAVDERIPLWQ